VRWIALIWGKLLDTLYVIISPIENFLEPLEVEEFPKNWGKSEISRVSVESEK